MLSNSKESLKITGVLIFVIFLIGCSSETPVSSNSDLETVSMGLGYENDEQVTRIIGKVDVVETEQSFISLRDQDIVIFVDNHTSVRYNNTIQSRNVDLSILSKGDSIFAYGTQVSRRELKATYLEIFTSSRQNRYSQ